MSPFQPSYGAAYGKAKGGSTDYTSLIEAGAGLLTDVGVKALTARGDRKRADAQAKRDAALEKERRKTMEVQARLTAEQAKLAAAQKPEAPETPAWVVPAAVVGGVTVLGLIGFIALRKK
jgi:hypothetical protein